jgi:hypothetical protein
MARRSRDARKYGKVCKYIARADPVMANAGVSDLAHELAHDLAHESRGLFSARVDQDSTVPIALCW